LAVADVGGTVGERFTMIPAFTVTMTPQQANGLAHSKAITVVEENDTFEIASATETGLNVPLNSKGNPSTLWGLDRIDQLTPTNPRVDNSYTWCADGSGVRAYVIDTGIRYDYGDIAGRVDRAIALKNLLASYPTSDPLHLDPTDCWNDQTVNNLAAAAHGTGVATIIGGTRLGVAKGVTLVDARTLNCQAGRNDANNMARIVRVLQWICQEDVNRTGHPSVINISISQLTRDASASALNAQITATVRHVQHSCRDGCGKLRRQRGVVLPGKQRSRYQCWWP